MATTTPTKDDEAMLPPSYDDVMQQQSKQPSEQSEQQQQQQQQQRQQQQQQQQQQHPHHPETQQIKGKVMISYAWQPPESAQVAQELNLLLKVRLLSQNGKSQNNKFSFFRSLLLSPFCTLAIFAFCPLCLS